MKISCDFCGVEKEEVELVKFGEAKICVLCELNQDNKKKYGKKVKGAFENSWMS